MDDHQLKKSDFEVVGELAHVCAQIVFTYLYLARIGRPDLLWSLNILARTATKWNGARDQRLARLISHFISRTTIDNSVVLVIKLTIACWVCSKTLHLERRARLQVNVRVCLVHLL